MERVGVLFFLNKLKVWNLNTVLFNLSNSLAWTRFRPLFLHLLWLVLAFVITNRNNELIVAAWLNCQINLDNLAVDQLVPIGVWKSFLDVWFLC
jgi:hypothetical protein